MASTTDSMPKSADNEINSKMYFAVYCLCFMFDGFILGMLGSIYGELQTDLNASTLTVSWIYSSLSIGYMVSSIVCGYISDRVIEVHRVQSLVIFICSLCVMAVPFIDNIETMFVLFALIGIGWAANETHFTLFVFRLYPMNGTVMYFVAALIVIIFSGITPIAVQLSIDITGSYTIPFIVFGIIGLSHSIAVLFLPTPKHDELRTLKRQISEQKLDNSAVVNHETTQTDTRTTDTKQEGNTGNVDLARSASLKLADDPQYDKLRNLTVFLLILTMGTHGMIEKGTLAFITTYCLDIGIDVKWGRYMISLYYYSSIAYRLLRHFCFPKSSLALHIIMSYIIRILLMMVFIFFGDGTMILFVLYGALGFCSSVVLPGLCGFAELIRPTTGMIACLWWAVYGLGDGILTFVMGFAIDNCGARVMPIVIAIPMVIGLLLSLISWRLYVTVREKETAALNNVTSDATGRTERSTNV